MNQHYNRFKEYKNLKPESNQEEILLQERYNAGLELGRKREAKRIAKEKDFEILEMRRKSFEQYLLNCVPKSERKRLMKLYNTYYSGMYIKTMNFFQELTKCNNDNGILVIISEYKKHFVEVSNNFSPKGLVRHYDNIISMFSFASNEDDKKREYGKYVYN